MILSQVGGGGGGVMGKNDGEGGFMGGKVDGG